MKDFIKKKRVIYNTIFMLKEGQIVAHNLQICWMFYS